MENQASGNPITGSRHHLRMKFFALTLVLSLLVISCASGGDGWREKDFVVIPAGGQTWWVSYEGQLMTRTRARDYLLYHTAQLVLDKGGRYFTFEESKANPESTEPSTPASEQPPSVDTEADNPRGRYGIPMTYGRQDMSRVAVVEMVDEPGPGVLTASAVIEEMEEKYSGSGKDER